MKSTLSILFLLALSATLKSQNKLTDHAFTIKGQLSNCSEKKLIIFFRDKNGKKSQDTIKLDENGKFYLKTYKLKEPQLTSLQGLQDKSVQINDFFVAPGYDLTVTGNAKDFFSLLKTTKISGVGAESNNYRATLIAERISRMDTTNWLNLNKEALISYINYTFKLKDSIASVVFNKKTIKDPYLSYFGTMVRLDNKFELLYMLLFHINENHYSIDSSEAILTKNFDKNILDNIYNNQYFISNNYRNLITNNWLDYLINTDMKMGKTPKHIDCDYKLKKINTAYKGLSKEFALYYIMETTIEFSNSFQTINSYKEVFNPYISSFKNKYYSNSLQNSISEKEAEIVRTQVGKPAPKFKLQSSLGDSVSIDDFKGKVVYIDLWASWCHPCREESPSFKRLYDKFKNDPNIVFLSIAVSDGIEDWKKALKEDKPTWTQLIDHDRIVSNAYVARAIPKFILIDKKGNIANWNAPRPSDIQNIVALLNKEIEKQ